MKQSQMSALALAAMLSLSFSSMARADEDADRLNTAPAAVKVTAKSLMGDHKLEGFDKEQEDGKTVYELDYSIESSDYAAVIGEDGKIIQTEVEIDASIVPAVVVDAAKKAQPNAKIKEIAIISAGGKLFYEFETKVGDASHDITINADGSLIADKVAAPEADAKDKEKGDEKDEKGKTEK